ncbi:hypothetical protein VTN31DRAFT_968 [Thermomyces dupontii]|uniref:uncharacterized protein n=1 Tax=Talaromyces thermophilus TaxID=28565 RepID=UPI0037430DDC
MWLHPQPALALASFVVPSLAAAVGFDCSNVRVDGVQFDLSPLGGVHEIWHVEEFDDYVLNTTWVLNICGILGKKSIRGDLRCGTSMNVCGFEEKIIHGEVEQVRKLPIAGLQPGGGGSKDPEITRLKGQDPDTEGVRVKLSGGEIHEPDSNKKRGKPASAVFEFQCDPDRTGLEGLPEAENSDESRRRRRNEDNEDEGGDHKPNDDDRRSLRFKSFGPVDDKSYVLRMDWRTRYACENYVREHPKKSGGHWGFFTWLIIIVFLGAAAYLIFGSWLNYNRYGARGWDLLPHGDTIRDIPYILQDWIRRVVNTLQGPGPRGGYSAV